MSEDILDVNSFMDRVQHDKELFFELLDIFVNDFQTKRKELGEAVEKKDYETVEHVSHFLKGSCGNISVESLRAIFHELETNGREKNIDGAENYLQTIDQKFEELMAYIGELRTRF